MAAPVGAAQQAELIAPGIPYQQNDVNARNLNQNIFPQTMQLQFANSGHELVATWIYNKVPHKIIAKRVMAGGGVGVGVGALAAGIAVAVTRGKASMAAGKIFAISCSTGFAAGALAGLIDGKRTIKQEIRALRQAEDFLAGTALADVDAVCAAFFEAHFSPHEYQVSCAISHFMMSFPVRITECDCNATYQLENIVDWHAVSATCPMCRTPFTVGHLQFDDAAFTAINDLVGQSLAILADIAETDLYDSENIAAMLDAGEGPIITPQTVDHIQQGTLTRLEACVIAQYLRSGLVGFNETIDGIRDRVFGELEDLRENNILGPNEYMGEVAKLHNWHTEFRAEV